MRTANEETRRRREKRKRARERARTGEQAGETRRVWTTSTGE